MANFYPKVFVLILLAACTAAFTTTAPYAEVNHSASTTESNSRNVTTSESSSSESNSSESGSSESDPPKSDPSESNSSESGSSESDPPKSNSSDQNSSESDSSESDPPKSDPSEPNSSESSSSEEDASSAKLSSTPLPAAFADSPLRAAEQDTLLYKVQALSDKVQTIYDHVMSEGKKGAACSPPTNKMHVIPAMAGEISTLETKLPEDTFQPKPCGGFVEHFSESELVYRFPENYPPGYEQGCIWIVWTNSPSEIRIQTIPDNEAQFHSDFLLRTYARDRNGRDSVEGLGSMNSSVSVVTSSRAPFVLIHFYGKPTKRGQGLHLRLVNTYRENSATLHTPHMFELDQTVRSGSLSYPRPPQAEYGKNEFVFIMGRGMDRQSLNLTVTNINTEVADDWIRVFWMDHRHLTQKLRMTPKTSGPEAPDMNVHFNQGVPFVLIFTSDGSNFGTGFKVNYDYYDTSADQASNPASENHDQVHMLNK